MKKHVDIIQAIGNRRLFGGLFKSLDTWRAWIVFLKSIFGLGMDRVEIEIYRRCTNRTILLLADSKKLPASLVGAAAKVGSAH